MTYTTQSNLKGTGAASAASIVSWFRSQNPNAPAELGDAIAKQCAAAGMNSDIVAAQICHETGWWESYAATQLNNPAGVGITNDLPRDQWPGFPSIQAGIHAQVAHLWTYTDGDANPWKDGDPRYDATRGSDMFGKARVIQDLEQHWAWSPPADYNATPPSQRYASRIAALANDLLAFAGTSSPAPSPTGGATVQLTYPLVEAIIPKSNSNRPGYAMDPEYITVHETANTAPGADADMHARFLANGGGSEGVSFHYCVDDHHATHMIPDNENAWHAWDGANGTGNRKSIAIETCVNSDGDWPKTLANLAQLIAYLSQKHNIPIANVVEHNHWSGKDCPHIMRLAPPEFDKVVANANDLLSGASEPDHLVIDVPGVGQKWIEGAIYERYADRVDALQVWGLPLTGMFTDGDDEVQVFERAIFRHRPGAWPAKFDVLLDLVGVMEAQRRTYRDKDGNPLHPDFLAVSDPGDGSWFTETGHTLRQGFRAYYDKHGGLDVFGYPLSEEFVEVGDDGEPHTVQYFERARMEWHHGVNPNDYDVLLGRLGADLLSAKQIPNAPQ